MGRGFSDKVRGVATHSHLEPSGQRNVIHYVSQLNQKLGDASAYSIAIEILGGAGTQPYSQGRAALACAVRTVTTKSVPAGNTVAVLGDTQTGTSQCYEPRDGPLRDTPVSGERASS